MVNSTVVGFSGLRGGVGTTSMAALLAAALQRSGQSVLLVDLNDSDLLRLHFDIPQTDPLGWGGVFWEGVHWKCQLQPIEENLWILPYGRQAEHPVRVNTQVITSIFTLITDAINADEIPFNLDWVIFDLPSHQTLIREVLPRCDLHFLVAEADFAAHILLGQYDFTEHTYLLLNKLSPKIPLTRDVVEDWQERYHDRVLPVRFSWDAHLFESLAHQRTALTHAPESAAACSAIELARWCLANPEKN